MKKSLIIFIKNPELGKVKTRLAKTVGDEKALQIYLALLQHTRRTSLQLQLGRLLFYDQFIPEKDDWNESDFEKHLQSEGNLGQRMTRAFLTAFEKYDQVVIIGSDCASLSPEILQSAFQQLDTQPYVIGPATDGGYYLLGVNKSSFRKAIFEDIEWSTDSVLQSTLQKIIAFDSEVFLLPELSDIDREEDWLKYGWELND